MATPFRLAQRLRPRFLIARASPRAFSATSRVASNGEWPQTAPIGAYYEEILKTPSPYPFEEKPEEPPKSSDDAPELANTESEPEPTPRPAKKKPGRKPKNGTSASAVNPTPAGEPLSSPPVPPKTTTPAAATTTTLSAADKARLVFGTPELKKKDEEARLAARAASATVIAGVSIPPRPEEPDTCCMSGCVNCVWDLYRDEMEDWTAKTNEAKLRLQGAPEAGDATTTKGATAATTPAGVRVGGAKIAKDLFDDEAFQNVPVGIREFMKLEKKLRGPHQDA